MTRSSLPNSIPKYWSTSFYYFILKAGLVLLADGTAGASWADCNRWGFAVFSWPGSLLLEGTPILFGIQCHLLLGLLSLQYYASDSRVVVSRELSSAVVAKPWRHTSNDLCLVSGRPEGVVRCRFHTQALSTSRRWKAASRAWWRWRRRLCCSAGLQTHPK